LWLSQDRPPVMVRQGDQHYPRYRWGVHHECSPLGGPPPAACSIADGEEPPFEARRRTRRPQWARWL